MLMKSMATRKIYGRMLERTVNALYLFSIIYEAYIPHNEKLFDLWSFLTVRNYKWPQKSTVITMLFSFI